uniref:Tumor necrosis factor alpha-induced protein 8-like protein n=1 Tax=Timema poppense TaxID=170557 RepID=A0A7R9GZ65_TIMPO|nr:unnamed protein product [Timema poppensis]
MVVDREGMLTISDRLQSYSRQASSNALREKSTCIYNYSSGRTHQCNKNQTRTHLHCWNDTIKLYHSERSPGNRDKHVGKTNRQHNKRGRPCKEQQQQAPCLQPVNTKHPHQPLSLQLKVRMHEPLMSEGFKAHDIGLRAQKKILGRMANKNIAKVFIDDTTASLLDNVYKLAKAYTGNKKEAEKIVKNIIKVVIKLGVLYRNGQFSADELRQAERFKTRFHSASMAVISFYEVDFSYDRHYLLSALNESRAAIRQLVQRHLTDKSLGRIDHVFGFFGNPAFLDAVFKKDSEYRDILGRIVADMNRAMDEGGM